MSQYKAPKDSSLREEFYRRLLYLATAITPVYLFATQKGSIRYIAVIFILVVSYQFIRIVQDSQAIIDDFFPPKVENEKVVTPFNRMMNYLALIIFFAGLIGQIFQITPIENTIHGSQLFWTTGLLGLVLALLLTLLLKKFTPSVYHESSRRYTIHFGLFIGLFLLVPAIMNFINQYAVDSQVSCQPFEIKRKSRSTHKSQTYFLFVKTSSQKEERFEVDQRIYNKVEVGETIQLCTKQGHLGYEYVTQFKPSFDE